VLDWNEYDRWMKSSDATLKSARADPDLNWACFKAERAAQLALKALLHLIGKPAWGHGLISLAESTSISGYDMVCLQFLSRLYISSRYPDAFPERSAEDYFSEEDKQKATECSKKIIDWVKSVAGDLRRAEEAQGRGHG